jgi:hypothetical protein
MDFLKILELLSKFLQKQMTNFLDEYNLRQKMITYLKIEGSNLNVMIIALKSIVNYETMGSRWKKFKGLGFVQVC